MKKNDLMGYLVYILMLGGAVWVGLSFIRPTVSDENFARFIPMNGIVLVLLSVLVGVVLNAVILELGHFIGAKIGKYKITSLTCLGIQFKRKKDDKFKLTVGGFDGITGETKVVPLDSEKSNPRHMIYMPLVFFLVEVAICVVLMSVSKSAMNAGNGNMITPYLIALVDLTVGCLIFMYNIFPAALDSKNDGQYIAIFNNETNVKAFNEILIANDKMARGEDVGETPIYDSVTDFTVKMNDVALYKALQEKKFDEALRINELTIASKDKVSARTYLNAIAQKMALHLYLNPRAEAVEEYKFLKHDEKRFIADLGTAPAVRAYLLVSGLVEESEGEVKVAMDKADAAIKSSGEDKRAVEETLMKEGLKMIMELHPDWDFSEYAEALK